MAKPARGSPSRGWPTDPGIHEVLDAAARARHGCRGRVARATSSSEPSISRTTIGRCVWPKRQSAESSRVSARSASRSLKMYRSSSLRRTVADEHGVVDRQRSGCERGEVRLVLGAERLARPVGRPPGDGIEAARVLEAGRHLVVIPAHDGRGFQRADPLDDGVRVAAVSDQVAQDDNAVVPARRRGTRAPCRAPADWRGYRSGSDTAYARPGPLVDALPPCRGARAEQKHYNIIS